MNCYHCADPIQRCTTSPCPVADCRRWKHTATGLHACQLTNSSAWAQPDPRELPVVEKPESAPTGEVA